MSFKFWKHTMKLRTDLQYTTQYTTQYTKQYTTQYTLQYTTQFNTLPEQKRKHTTKRRDGSLYCIQMIILLKSLCIFMSR